MKEDIATPEYVQRRLDEWGVRHFTAAELLRARRWDRLQEPPVGLVRNVEKTILIADFIREIFGGPVKALSIYRGDEYNRHVGGKPGSEHKEFKAGDFGPGDHSRMEEFRAIAVAVVKLAREFGWNVGLGYYDWGVHIDVDAEGKRRNRTWDYR